MAKEKKKSWRLLSLKERRKELMGFALSSKGSSIELILVRPHQNSSSEASVW